MVSTERRSKGPLWLLIVLISPLDSSLIAPLCLQGHHYSDQAQLCFPLLFHEYHFAKTTALRSHSHTSLAWKCRTFFTLWVLFFDFSKLTPGTPSLFFFPFPCLPSLISQKCPPGFRVWRVREVRLALPPGVGHVGGSQILEFVACWKKRAQLPSSSFVISPLGLWGYDDKVSSFFLFCIWPINVLVY